MRLVNALMNGVFDRLLWPCQGTSPWPGLVVSSLLSAAIFVLLFRLTSNQPTLQRARNRFVARTLELLLYQHDLRVTITACGRILAANAAYLFQFLLPVGVGLIPLLLLFSQLESWFEYRPFRIGEPVVLTVQFDAARSVIDTPVELRHSAHIRTDSPSVRMPSRNEMAWRLVAVAPGDGWAEVTIGGVTERISVVTGNQLARLAPRREPRGVISELLSPSALPLPAAGPIRQMEISYPRRKVEWGFDELPWTVVVFALMMPFSLVFATVLGIRIV